MIPMIKITATTNTIKKKTPFSDVYIEENLSDKKIQHKQAVEGF